MAFIRARLNKVFGGIDDTQVTPTSDTQEKKRQQSVAVSVADSGYASAGISQGKSPNKLSRPATPSSNHAEEDTIQSAKRSSPSKSWRCKDSPKKNSLPKMASTTIKLVSDTIRAKASMFYVSPIQPETPSPVKVESPTKRDRAAQLLSSLRSRNSRNFKPDLNDEEPEICPIVSFDMPHELDVEIPNSSLLEQTSKITRQSPLSFLIPIDRNPDADHQAHCQGHGGSTDPFVTRQLSKGGSKSVVPTSAPALVDLVRTTPSPPDQTFHNVSAPSITSQAKSKDAILLQVEDKGYTTDTESNGDVLTTNENSPMNAAPVIAPAMVQSMLPKSLTRGSLFVKGAREHNRSGSPSPYRRVLLGHNTSRFETDVRPLVSITKTDTTGGAMKEEQRSCTSAGGDVTLPRGRESIQPDDPLNTTVDKKQERKREFSRGYEADGESSADVTENPSMGSRLEWEKVRADRQRRYQKVSNLSAATEEDTEERTDLELTPCSDVLSMESQKGLINGTVGAMTLSTGSPQSRKVQFNGSSELKSEDGELNEGNLQDLQKTVPPGETDTTNIERALQYAIEAVDRPTGEELVQERATPLSGNCPLRYAVEAIERTNGRALEQEEAELPLSASTIQHVVEAIGACSNDGIEAIDEERSYSLHHFVANKGLLSVEPLHVRKTSSHSISTTDSCAITTDSALRYSPDRVPSVHVRTSPVRRASSINDELNEALNVQEDDLPIMVPPPDATTSPSSAHVDPSSVLRVQKNGDTFVELGSQEADRECWLRLMVEVKKDENCRPDSQRPGYLTNKRKTRNNPKMKSTSELNVSRDHGLGNAKQHSDLRTPHTTRSSQEGLDMRSLENLSPLGVFLRLPNDKPCSPRSSGQQGRQQIEDLPSLPSSADTPYHDSPAMIDVTLPTSSCSIRRQDKLPTTENSYLHIGKTRREMKFESWPSTSNRATPEAPVLIDRVGSRTLDPQRLVAERQNLGQSVDEAPASTPPPSLRRARRAKRESARGLSHHLAMKRNIHEMLFKEEDMSRDFVAARLPVFRNSTPAPKATQLCGMASSTLEFLGSIGSTSPPSLVSNIDESSFIGGLTRTISSGSKKGHGRNRSWAMRESSFGGEEFTYDAVGSLKTDFQTSSQKKGVWWNRCVASFDENDSPLVGKNIVGASAKKDDVNGVARDAQTYPGPTDDKAVKEGRLSLPQLRSSIPTAILSGAPTDYTEKGKAKVQSTDGQSIKCGTPEPSPTKLTPSALGTPKEHQQDQDAAELCDFLTTPLWIQRSEKAFQRQAPVESGQEQEMVNRSEESWIIGTFPLPRATPPRASSRFFSNGSWTSFECEE